MTRPRNPQGVSPTPAVHRYTVQELYLDPARTLEMRCIGENQREPSLDQNMHQLPTSGAMGEGLPKDSSHTRPLLKAKHRAESDSRQNKPIREAARDQRGKK